MKHIEIPSAASMRSCMLAAFAVLVIALLQSTVAAATYYVRTDGNDSNTGLGSEASSAWQTLDHAVNASLSAGDIVYVKSGTYAEKLDVKVSGTSGNPIQIIADVGGTIAGWSPGTITLDANGLGEAILIDNQDYVEFIGFRVQGNGSSSNTVFLKDATGIELTQCELYSGIHGIWFEGPTTTCTTINCLIRNCSGDGIHMQDGTATIYYCTIVNNSGDGLDAAMENATVINSIIAGNGGFGIVHNSTGDGTLTHFYNQLYGNSSGNFNGTSAAAGEIFTDPQFVSSSDFHLRSTSPAVDATFDVGVAEDFHSNPRFFGSGYDMGYHEYGSTQGTASLLMVTANSGYFTTEERRRKSTFEALGYSVTPIDDGDTQTNFDTAIASADVVYVSEQATASNVGYKLREATIGVMFEESALTDEMGMSTSYYVPPIRNTLTNLDTSHYILSPFTGSSTITTTNSNDDVSSLNGTIASGAQRLGDWNGISNALVVIETGGTLVNTYSSSNVAFGRRVALPLNGGFDWNGLTDDGLTIIERSLTWVMSGSSGNGLIGHWKLDETSGTTAADSSGNGNDGTYTSGPILGGTGVYGHAAAFDGVNDHVSISAGSDYNLTQNVTVSCWAKSDTATWSGWGCLVSKRNQFYLYPSYGGTYIYFAGDTVGAGDESAGVDMSTIGSIQDWHHYAGVYDYDAGEVRFYVDGKLRATNSITPNTALESDTGALTIGWDDGNSGTRYFDGLIDEVKLFNSALSDAEVLALYGIKGHYKLDETSGTTAADSSGTGADGTYVNGPTLGSAGTRKTSVVLNSSDTNDRIDLPNTTLDGASAAGFAWWMKTARTGETVVISGANASTSFNEFTLTYFSSSTLRSHVGGTWQDFSIGSVNDDRWHHFVYQIDRVTGLEEVYVDGELTASNTRTSTSDELGIDPNGLVIGQEQDSVGGGFDSSQILDGEIDDLWIFDRKLTQQEIAEIYGLIGHWKLDEGSGTTAVDSSLLSNGGAYINGVTLNQAGPYPNYGAISAEFDGTNDQVEAPHHDAYNSDEAVSIAMWVKRGSVTWWDTLLSKGKFGNPPYIFAWAGDGGLTFKTDTSNVIADGSVREDKWTHLAVTYDETEVRFYIDGKLDSIKSLTTQLTTDSTLGLNIGAAEFDTGYADGNLFDVRLYNRVITAEEIAEMYGLIGHWKMDEGSGTTAADSTAYANDATLNGASWTTDCSGKNAIVFDGVSNTATTNSNLNPPALGAVAFWMRASGDVGARQRVFGVNGDWEARVETTGVLSFDLGKSPIVGNEPFTTTSEVDEVDRWYHIVAQFNDTDDTFEVYVNGELEASGVSPVDLVKQPEGILSFGTRTGSIEYWEGALRDFRVYDRWLSGSEISSLSGLVGYWKLDETSGTVAVDSSALDNDGTYTNGVVINQAGNVGQAATFDGLDDYVGVPDDPSLQMDDTFSLSAWIRADSSANVNQMIVNKEGEYELAVFPGGELHWAVTNTDPGWAWHGTGHVVAIGQWTHVAMTYDNGTVNTYADGRLVDTYNGSGSIGDQYTSLNELRIGGRSNNPPNKYFDGRLDDVKVFNRVLCPTEIFSDYKGGRPAGVRILKWVEAR